MKFECYSKKLLAAIRRVMPATNTGAKLQPVLSCVLIRAEGGEVSVSATDMNTWIRAVVEAEYRQPGVVAIAADKLAATLAELDGESVTLETGDQVATLQCRSGRYEFPTHPADQFPEPPSSDEGGNWFDVSAESLRTLIRRTAFASDRAESTRKFLTTGAAFERSGDTAVMVATDTKRVALASAAVVASSGEITRVNETPPVIPVKVLHAIDKALEGDETIRVRLRANDAQFVAPRWSLYTALLVGKFPPYRKLFDQKPTVTVKVNSSEFVGAVRRAAVMTDAESMRVDIEFAPAVATLTARGANKGTSSVTESLPGFEGPTVSVAFDPHYLIEWLKAVGDREVAIEIAKPERAVAFRADDEAQYLVMPLTG